MASKLLHEFREFAVKGSVVDLAVGIIIGTAFGAIVKSLVEDLIMPAVGVLFGGLDYSSRYVVLKGDPGNATTLEAARAAGASVLAYGRFLDNVVTFVIVAWAVFLLIKGINRLRRRKEAPPPNTRPCPECLTAIPKAARRCMACTGQVDPVP